MANILTNQGAIELAKKACSAAQKCLVTAANTLQSKYEAAGSGWQDSKYRELRDVISTANRAINAPLGDLAECISSLSALQAILTEYEEA